MGPRVFIVQESAGKNFVQAQQFGAIVTPPLLPMKSNIAWDSAPHVARIFKALQDFGDEDYLLLTGDPAAIGVACAVASVRNAGRYKCLKWDKQDDLYYPVQIDLKEGELSVGEDGSLNQRVRRASGGGRDLPGSRGEGRAAAYRR